MPGLNQRGPMGHGPMTGRKMGCCNSQGKHLKKQNSEQTENSAQDLPEMLLGRGIEWGRWGRGRGMGRQHRFRGGF
jgi:hypothetical protein